MQVKKQGGKNKDQKSEEETANRTPVSSLFSYDSIITQSPIHAIYAYSSEHRKLLTHSTVCFQIMIFFPKSNSTISTNTDFSKQNVMIKLKINVFIKILFETDVINSSQSVLRTRDYVVLCVGQYVDQTVFHFYFVRACTFSIPDPPEAEFCL